MPTEGSVLAAPTSPRQAYAALIATVLAFGMSWPLTKLGLAHASPVWLAAMRTAIGAATLFALMASVGRLRLPPRGDIPMMLSGGCLQMAGFLGFSTAALQFVEVGRSAVLSFTTSIWVTPLAILLLGERLTPLRALGVGLGLAGVAAMMNPAAMDWSDGNVLAGHAMLLLAALSWGLCVLHARVHRWRLQPFELAPWQAACATATLLVMAAVGEGQPRIDATPEFFGIVLFIGVFGAGLGFCGTMIVSRALPSITVSILFLAVPALGVGAAIVFLGEELTPALLAGMVLIFAGVAVVSLSDRRSGRRAV